MASWPLAPATWRRFWFPRAVPGESSRRTARGKRRRAPLRLRGFEPLEDRRLLSAVPSAYEQYALELLNRARQNPLAEAARYGIDLNEGLPAGTISSAPKQPLAFNDALLEAARLHAQDMLDNDFFDHVSSDGRTLVDRVTEVGYPALGVGENLAVRWTSGGSVDLVDFIAQMHQSLFVNADVDGRGHRRNLLDGNFKEEGGGVEQGLFSPDGPGTTAFNAVMYVQNFGQRPGDSFLTGVAYRDLDGDQFYSVGEGIGALTVTAVGAQTFSTQTTPAGGYNLRLPAGTYTVTVTGAGLSGAIVVQNVVIGSQNVKLDFNPSLATWVDVQIADFNGDGRDDVAGRAAATGNWWVMLSGPGANSSTNQFWGKWSTAVEWRDVRVGDFNNDGRADIAGRVAGTGEWWVALTNGAGNGSTNVYWGRFAPAVQWLDVRVGDFNGDGRDDIAGRAANSGEWWVALSQPGGGSTNQYWGRWSPGATWTDVQVGDFSGDGRADLAGRVAASGEWWVAVSQAGGGSNNHFWGRFSTAANWVDFRAGDFNGDGRLDIAGRVLASGEWWVAKTNNTGTGALVQYWAKWSPGVQWTDVRVGDLNGDGRDDLIGRVATTGQWWALVTLASGNGATSHHWGTWSPATTWIEVRIGDFDGNGRADLIGRQAATGHWWIAAANSPGLGSTNRYLGQWGV